MKDNKFTTSLTHHDICYKFYSIAMACKQLGVDSASLPYSIKVLLENSLHLAAQDQALNTEAQVIANFLQHDSTSQEISFSPGRVLMQDFTGVPAVVDLAAMRDIVAAQGGDPNIINPVIPVDLVIDHSIQVDFYGNSDALARNSALEMQRNQERYTLLRWAQQAFNNFRVVPPNVGICHQVNLEYLSQVVMHTTQHSEHWLYPDTVVGTDSHTTMVNALGVLGWGVGGIEAEAAMLGQPISMLIPKVIGVKLTGALQEGVTATDLVLTITAMLRKIGVVACFVEYCGPGLDHLSLADRATLANMAPEYGATCGFFPVDQQTLTYLALTGRSKTAIEIVELYTKAQGLWRDSTTPIPSFSQLVELDLASIEPCLAGPKRPQDRVPLAKLREVSMEQSSSAHTTVTNQANTLTNGDVVLAAITSCTNTSNPQVMLAAGLVAKKAVAKGLTVKPWVKTSLAPGSQIVTNYLERSGLQKYLDKLGFFVVGHGCTTCIGNSGPLKPEIAAMINEQNLAVAAVLSGNRNFEGRIHPQIKANWLASPPLVIIFALTGTTNIDLLNEPIAYDQENKPVFMKDIWPSTQEIAEQLDQITAELFISQYKDIFVGSPEWQSLPINSQPTYNWDDESTYIKKPDYFSTTSITQSDISSKILAIFSDSVTTDHISPAGSIHPNSPAGQYLLSLGITANEFNSYGARRGNHEIMMRGTFANTRIRNLMLSNQEGGLTKYLPSQEILSIYDAAMRYQAAHVPMTVIAGKEYGTGSSRDWAAKGPRLLGVKTVIAVSFERIHRSNLIGMGILPLQFMHNMNAQSLALNGDETIIIHQATLIPQAIINATIIYADKTTKNIQLLSRIDTENEQEYYNSGGILPYVLKTKFA